MPTAEEAAADAAPGHGREGGAQPWAQAATEEEAVGTAPRRRRGAADAAPSYGGEGGG
jgi:hypothetical protein